MLLKQMKAQGKICVCVYVCVCACVCLFTYIQTHLHTHKHTGHKRTHVYSLRHWELVSPCLPSSWEWEAQNHLTGPSVSWLHILVLWALVTLLLKCFHRHLLSGSGLHIAQRTRTLAFVHPHPESPLPGAHILMTTFLCLCVQSHTGTMGPSYQQHLL